MIYNLYKPRSISSNQYLSWFKRRFQIKTAGFIGTLDPLAAGVLPVFTGKLTKLIPFYDDFTKIYRFTFKLGLSSISLDSENQISFLEKPLPLIKPLELMQALNHFMDYQQQAPLYSAISLQGQSAYHLARFGRLKTDKLPYKRAQIFQAQVLRLDGDTIELIINCSKGFYVRSLIRDLARYFKTEAIALDIERLQNGDYFKKENSLGLNQLLKLDDLSQIKAADTSKVFSAFPKIRLNQNLIEKICLGQKIVLNLKDCEELPHIKVLSPYCLVYNTSGLIISIGRLLSYESNENDAEGHSRIFKPIKLLKTK